MNSNTFESLRNSIVNVEIEINSRCNRRCSYCPVSILPNPDVPKFMADRTLDRILNELKKIDYSGRLSYHFYNEPLLRKDLADIVRKVKVQLPNCRQVLFTNGDHLSESRYQSLYESGISYFVITSHSGKVHPDRKAQVVQFSSDLELTNRGGVLEHLSDFVVDVSDTPCFAPSEMLVITVTGDVVLCYEDAFRKHVVGNIIQQDIENIWFSEKFTQIRKQLANGNRHATEICLKCSNHAHVTPGVSAHSEPFWKGLNVE